ncbi:hypothetical protein [Brevundimonas sp.]|uniref:hypothetical protein n=1 Tax=Brevundimonas sp. TaxID=1871086 RepID=UPI001A2BBDCA|nr:hypothetical protein [Brevundimonas sp.]MBJ7484048.1 hypothetical protein [Brevundimonas sp.]
MRLEIPRAILVLATGLFLATGLSGCVTSSTGDTIKPLSADRARDASIGDIVLVAKPDTVSAEFAGIFETRVREELAKCATGSSPLRLNVRIIEMKGANAAMTVLVGDSNVIRGSAALIDPATGEIVGDYEINQSTGGGGLIAAVSMGQAEEQMSRAFGKALCDRAFAD